MFTKYKGDFKMKIKEVCHVDSNDNGIFLEEVQEVVNRLQEKGVDVEIQYSTAPSGNYNVKYSALILGKSKE